MNRYRRRHDLYTRLAEALGAQAADTLMAYLLPIGWADVATMSEVRTLGVELRAEMAELRSDLRVEMAELRSGLRGEMAEMRGSLQRTVIAASMASSVSTATLVLAAAVLV